MDLPYFKSYNYIQKYEVNNLCHLRKARPRDLCQVNTMRAPLFISAKYSLNKFTCISEEHMNTFPPFQFN